MVPPRGLREGASHGECTQKKAEELIKQELAKERLAWYESDEALELFKEALELFKTGQMMYPEVTIACLRERLAKL